MNSLEKIKKYEALLRKRRDDLFCNNFGFVNPWLDKQLRAEDEFRQAVDFVDFGPDHSPPQQRNLDVDVFILGQDFANVESVREFVTTRSWGKKDHFGDRLNYIKRKLDFENNSFTSNLVPFFKARSMSAELPSAFVRYCAKEYARELINIVQPKVVYLLGERVTRAMFREYKMECQKGFYEMVDAPAQRTPEGIWLVPVSHPGGMGWGNRKIRPGIKDREEQHLADWNRVWPAPS